MKIFVFQAGDAVMVTAKEEEAWWRGEVGGKSGVFPSNYVEPAKCKYIDRIFLQF